MITACVFFGIGVLFGWVLCVMLKRMHRLNRCYYCDKHLECPNCARCTKCEGECPLCQAANNKIIAEHNSAS